MNIFHPFHVIHYHGAAPLQRGQPAPPLALAPLIRHLQGYELLKLVAGPWGEVSQDRHGLLRTFTHQRVEALAGLSGRAHFSIEGEFGKIWGK